MLNFKDCTFCLVINNLYSGGAQRQAVNIVNGLIPYFKKVHLIMLSCKSENDKFFMNQINNSVNVIDCTRQSKIKSL